VVDGEVVVIGKGDKVDHVFVMEIRLELGANLYESDKNS